MGSNTESEGPSAGDPADGGARSLPAWGESPPGLLFEIVLKLSRAVPQLPLLKQLAFLLRRTGRALRPTTVDVVHWGLRLRLATRGNVSESTFLFMPGRWDVEERRFLAAHLAPGAMFVDVGTNAGGYLWWLQHILGSRWRALAVEPDPELGARLRFNLRTNRMDHVTVVEAAVGPVTGEARLRIDARNRGENVLVSPDPDATRPSPSRDSVAVRVLPLPELLEEAGLEQVDGLKIDVEGLEAVILEDFLTRAPDRLLPRILLTETRDSPEHRALLERLEENGYRVELRTRLNVGLRRVRARPT